MIFPNSISFNLDKLIKEKNENVKDSIDNFNILMERMPSIAKELDEVILMINDIIKNINSGNGTLSKLINQEELYNNVNGLVVDARSLLNDVKKNPAKYLSVFPTFLLVFPSFLLVFPELEKAIAKLGKPNKKLGKTQRSLGKPIKTWKTNE